VKNGFVSVNFGRAARQGVGQSLGKAAIVSMYLFGFDAAIHPPNAGVKARHRRRTTMDERYIKLIRSIVECPVNFSVDCLQGLRQSDDPLDREAYHEAMTFMAKLHSKLDRILQLCQTEGSLKESFDGDPFTP